MTPPVAEALVDESFEQLSRYARFVPPEKQDSFREAAEALWQSLQMMKHVARMPLRVEEGLCVSVRPACAATGMPATRLWCAAATDVGRVRTNNEDAVDSRLMHNLRLGDVALLVVCDGIGGRPHGEIASRLALNHIVEHMTGALVDGATEWGAHLTVGALRANDALLDLSRYDEELAGTSTTFAAIVTDGRRVACAHAGDSRVYLCRAGALRQLTLDHDLTWEALPLGLAGVDPTARSHRGGALTSALGISSAPRVEAAWFDLEPGDQLLVCSDGLYRMVEPAEIAAVLGRAAEPAQAAQELIERALAAGGKDNVSVAIARACG